MIVPMKKISVITQSKDAAAAISALRRLGTVHLEHQRPPKSSDLNLLRDDLRLAERAVEILMNLPEAEGKIENKPVVDWKAASRHIVDLWKRIDQLDEFSRGLNQKISEWEIWGDFDPQEIKRLEEKNIRVKLYQVPRRELDKLPKEAIVRQIAVKAGMVYCVVISRGRSECEFKEIELPKMSLQRMRRRLGEDQRIRESLQADLRSQAVYIHNLSERKQTLEKEIEFHEAVSGMAEHDKFNYLTGYLPFDAEKTFLRLAKYEKWGILVRDPFPEDNIPTLIRTPKWVSLINPVFKLLEVVPGYRELDISVPFLIFLSIFFGILIGDAGYGLVYLLLTFWFQRKYGRKASLKAVFLLFYILSSCAIVWGLLTGTFFGQEWLVKAGFKPLVPSLNEINTMLGFCFFLGALHLSIAHAWRAVLKFPSLAAFADTGWICVLWSAYLVAKTLIIGAGFPAFGKWLLIAGIAQVILFTSPQKNILKSVGSGLGALALSLMNNFTDVVSYMRLFAVGLATVAIANTFNSLAAGIEKNNIFALFLSLVIILVGHGLNILLGPMSVLVHGVRLNVLEFCSHIDVKWSGFAYKPLKE